MRECPICVRGAPLDLIAELPATWVSAAEEAPLPGYACVVSKRHVVEPFELAPAEMDAFWRESMLVARAVAGVVRPAKMNYEIHGNTLPHLHMHLFPRFPGDPYEGGPVDPARVSFTRSPASAQPSPPRPRPERKAGAWPRHRCATSSSRHMEPRARTRGILVTGPGPSLWTTTARRARPTPRGAP